MTLHLLQITDCHLVEPDQTLLGLDTQQSLEAVLATATEQQTPDAIIATGDLAHTPIELVYRRFLQTVREFSSAPLLCVAGNHDVRGAMEQAGLPFAPLVLGDWLVAGLDSHQDDQPPARVTEADRAEVARSMSAADVPHVLVTTHHPLVQVDCPWLDCDRIPEPEALLDWLLDASQNRLRGVAFGHAHQAIETQVLLSAEQLPVWGSPSTCFQFLPRSEKFDLDCKKPGFRWLKLAENGNISTRLGWADNFVGEAVVAG